MKKVIFIVHKNSIILLKVEVSAWWDLRVWPHKAVKQIQRVGRLTSMAQGTGSQGEALSK